MLVPGVGPSVRFLSLAPDPDNGLVLRDIDTDEPIDEEFETYRHSLYRGCQLITEVYNLFLLRTSFRDAAKHKLSPIYQGKHMKN